MSEREMTESEFDRMVEEAEQRREREAQEEFFRNLERNQNHPQLNPHGHGTGELEFEELIQRVAMQYFHLKNGSIRPNGFYAENRKWFPHDNERFECCNEITQPSARFPYTLLNHCRTIKHLAQKFNVDESLLRQAIRQQRIRNRNNRHWFDPVDCPKCHRHVESRYNDRSMSPNSHGLSRETKEALAMPFIVNAVHGETQDRQRFRVIRWFRCRYCSTEVLTVCTNEVYMWNSHKQQWIKMRGFKQTDPQPTELIILCPICNNQLREIKQYIKNINGIRRNIQEIQKSKRMICNRCKNDLNNNGFVYRIFEDFSMLRFCFSLNMWVPTTHSYNGGRNRRDPRQVTRDSLTYSQYQTPLERIVMHIKTKGESRELSESGLIKELEPFKEILNESEETEIVEALDSIKPHLIT